MLFYWVYVFSINLEQSIEALILLRKQNLKAITKTSLVVQWLRLQAPNAGALGSMPGRGTRSHMLQLKISHTAAKKKILRAAAELKNKQRKTNTIL